MPHATELPGCGRAQGANFSREFDYASYYIGARPAPGGPFEPDQDAGVWDWSPFTPAADGSDGLALATAKGMEQFGCCPKTSGGPGGRRVLWGWINNGWDQGPPEPHGLEPDRPRPGNGAWLTNNTMSLPRDLSYATRASGDRFVAQAFVPELQTLRRARTQLRAQTLHAGVVTLPPSAFGAQLEILATFRFPSAEAMSAAAADASQQFGLQVLASNGTAGDAERTVVRFDLRRKMVLLDRTSSGAELDADVRAGPLPSPTASVGGGRREISVHVYVDHSVVSLIAGGETAISAWVAPQRAESVGVALFSELVGGAVEADIDVWQLATPNHTQTMVAKHDDAETTMAMVAGISTTMAAEVVYDWQTEHCTSGRPLAPCSPEPCRAKPYRRDVPDAPAMAWRDPVSNLTFVAPGDSRGTWPSIGPSLDEVKHTCDSMIFNYSGVKGFLQAPSDFSSHEWLYSPYMTENGTLYMLAHNEFHGWEHAPELCNATSMVHGRCW